MAAGGGADAREGKRRKVDDAGGAGTAGGIAETATLGAVSALAGAASLEGGGGVEAGAKVGSALTPPHAICSYIETAAYSIYDDFASIDGAFRSITGVFPSIYSALVDGPPTRALAPFWRGGRPQTLLRLPYTVLLPA